MTPRSCTEPQECKSCKAPILWVKWPNSGKAMPIDDAPGTGVNHTVVVTHSLKMNTLWAEKYDESRHQGRRRFVSHFVTCPQAKQHRR